MSFKNELHFAIDFKPGTQKRETKAMEGRGMSSRVYSFAERDALHDTVNSFARWMKTNHPEVRHARELTYDHKAEYLMDCRSRGCSPATLRSYENRLDKLAHCCNAKYKSSHLDYMERSWCRTVQSDRDRFEYRVRTQVMTPEHYDRVRDTCTRSCGSRDALDLARAFGLRSREAVSVRVEDVRPDCLHVVGKGGREREIPITTSQQRDLLDRLCRDRNPGDRLAPAGLGTYQNYVRNHLERAGLSDAYPDTGTHSIRKLWAREQYFDCRSRGMTPDEAASAVTVLLGHGADRKDLVEIYLGEVVGK